MAVVLSLTFALHSSAQTCNGFDSINGIVFDFEDGTLGPWTGASLVPSPTADDLQFAASKIKGLTPESGQYAVSNLPASSLAATLSEWSFDTRGDLGVATHNDIVFDSSGARRDAYILHVPLGKDWFMPEEWELVVGLYEGCTEINIGGTYRASSITVDTDPYTPILSTYTYQVYVNLNEVAKDSFYDPGKSVATKRYDPPIDMDSITMCRLDGNPFLVKFIHVESAPHVPPTYIAGRPDANVPVGRVNTALELAGDAVVFSPEFMPSPFHRCVYSAAKVFRGDHSTSYMNYDVGPVDLSSDELTLSLWFVTSHPEAEKVKLIDACSGLTLDRFALGLHGARLEYHLHQDGKMFTLLSKDPVALNQWTHVAVRHSKADAKGISTIELWVNGVLSYSSTAGPALKPGIRNWVMLGEALSESNAKFTGVIQDVFMWNRVIDQRDLDSIRNRLAPSVPEVTFLVAHSVLAFGCAEAGLCYEVSADKIMVEVDEVIDMHTHTLHIKQMVGEYVCSLKPSCIGLGVTIVVDPTYKRQTGDVVLLKRKDGATSLSSGYSQFLQKASCGNPQCSTTDAAPMQAVENRIGRQNGECVLDDGTVQLDGMIQLDSENPMPADSKRQQECLSKCAAYGKHTACQLAHGLRDHKKNGCFVHTLGAHHGSGSDNYYCWAGSVPFGTASVTCPVGQVITDVVFADYGSPSKNLVVDAGFEQEQARDDSVVTCKILSNSKMQIYYDGTLLDVDHNAIEYQWKADGVICHNNDGNRVISTVSTLDECFRLCSGNRFCDFFAYGGDPNQVVVMATCVYNTAGCSKTETRSGKWVMYRVTDFQGGGYRVGNPIEPRKQGTANVTNTQYLAPQLKFTEKGRVVQWEVYVENTLEVVVAVWRPVPSAARTYRLIGANVFSPEFVGRQVLHPRLEEQIVVEPGDVIGWWTAAGVIPFDQDPTMDSGVLAVDFDPSQTDVYQVDHVATFPATMLNRIYSIAAFVGEEYHWSHCANEGQTCKCNELVRFGTRTDFIEDKVDTGAGSVVCDKAHFGDPHANGPLTCVCSETDFDPSSEFTSYTSNDCGPRGGVAIATVTCPAGSDLVEITGKSLWGANQIIDGCAYSSWQIFECVGTVVHTFKFTEVPNAALAIRADANGFPWLAGCENTGLVFTCASTNYKSVWHGFVSSPRVMALGSQMSSITPFGWEKSDYNDEFWLQPCTSSTKLSGQDQFAGKAAMIWVDMTATAFFRVHPSEHSSFGWWVTDGEGSWAKKADGTSARTVGACQGAAGGVMQTLGTLAMMSYDVSFTFATTTSATLFLKLIDQQVGSAELLNTRFELAAASSGTKTATFTAQGPYTTIRFESGAGSCVTVDEIVVQNLGDCGGFASSPDCFCPSTLNFVRDLCLGRSHCEPSTGSPLLDELHGCNAYPKMSLSMQVVCSGRVAGVGTVPGAFWEYFAWVPVSPTQFLHDVDWSQPLNYGYIDAIHIPAGLDHVENFALRYTTLLRITTAGDYQFKLSSDDGSDLYIDNQLICTDDGLHESDFQATGTANLTAGDHVVLVRYFQALGLTALNLAWMPPGVIYWVDVPTRALFRPKLKPMDAHSWELMGDFAPGLAYELFTIPYDSMIPSINMVDFTGVPKRRGSLPTITLLPGVTDDWDYFAMRFMGRLQITASGVYNFFVSSDDGCVLYIDGIPVVSDDGLHEATDELSGMMDLDAGYYNIELKYYEWIGQQKLKVSWNGPGIEKAVIPTEALSHRLWYKPIVFESDSSFTVESVIQTEGTGKHVIVSQYDGEHMAGWHHQLENGKQMFYIADINGDEHYVTGSQKVNDNVYHHLAVVVDWKADEIRLYFDHTLDGKTSLGGANVRNQQPVSIGALDAEEMGPPRDVAAYDLVRISAGALDPSAFRYTTSGGERVHGVHVLDSPQFKVMPGFEIDLWLAGGAGGVKELASLNDIPTISTPQGFLGVGLLDVATGKFMAVGHPASTDSWTRISFNQDSVRGVTLNTTNYQIVLIDAFHSITGANDWVAMDHVELKNVQYCNCGANTAGDQCQYSNADTCSGHGTATATGRCICERGWHGDKCKSQCDQACSGHGQCYSISDGVVACKCDGYWQGASCDKCSKELLNGQCGTCPCGQGGSCKDDGSCQCIEHFSGPMCSKTILEIMSPERDIKYFMGEPVFLLWNSQGPIDNVAITLRRTKNAVSLLGSRMVLATTPNSGYYKWHVPANQTSITAGTYVLRVEDATDSNAYMESEEFNLIDSSKNAHTKVDMMEQSKHQGLSSSSIALIVIVLLLLTCGGVALALYKFKKKEVTEWLLYHLGNFRFRTLKEEHHANLDRELDQQSNPGDQELTAVNMHTGPRAAAEAPTDDLDEYGTVGVHV